MAHTITWHRAKLTLDQIEEYFDVHLPYRTRIMLAHFRMTRVPWHGDVALLQAAFEAWLITGRMYLNVLGILKDGHDKLIPNRFRADDVSAEDLGGTLVDPGTLSPNDQDLLIGFHRMVDKGAARLTIRCRTRFRILTWRFILFWISLSPTCTIAPGDRFGRLRVWTTFPRSRSPRKIFLLLICYLRLPSPPLPLLQT